MQKNIEEQRLRGVSAHNLINKGYLMPTNTLTEDNKRMMFLRAGYPEEEIRAAYRRYRSNINAIKQRTQATFRRTSEAPTAARGGKRKTRRRTRRSKK